MFIFMLAAILMHPVHETVSEVEWNAETKRLEVALRLDVSDEQWLKQEVGGDDETRDWAVRYLRQKFRINKSTRRENRPAYHWIGRDDEGSHVWWYFEIEPADGRQPTMIEQTMLMERHKNYTNRVLILGQVPHRALTLTIQRPMSKLDPATDERSELRRSSPQPPGGQESDR